MVEQAPQYRSGDPDIGAFDEGTADHRVTPYRLQQSARTDYYSDSSVPLFLSDYDAEPDPSEYITPLRKRRVSISARILAGVCAAAAVAVLFALLTSDATRDLFVNVQASIGAVFQAPPAAAQSDPPQLASIDTQSKDLAKDLARLPTPANQTPGVRTAAVTPTREEITTAYRSALQSPAPAAPPPAADLITTADPIHHLDPDEIASSLKRGDALIASGDLAAARLVLRRAADAGDARAAMTIAETYDPAILEKLGVHGVVPDIAMARSWYEKAKTFGAAEATLRLEVLASRQH